MRTVKKERKIEIEGGRQAVYLSNIFNTQRDIIMIRTISLLSINLTNGFAN